jgi:hypothetical protein
MRCMQTMSLFTWDKQVAVKLTTPGWANARDDAPVHLAFRDSDHVGTQTILLSRLHGWPMRSPTDASPTPSRVPTHGSGPMRIASPSPWWTSPPTLRWF